MPLETITIRWLPDAPYEAAAEFFSVLAYPEKLDRTARLHFRDSLCRWAILRNCKGDPGWASQFAPIRPELLRLDPARARKTLKDGSKKLRERLAASVIVVPHLVEALEETPIAGLKPTVGNMAILGALILGWKGDDDSTFKSKVWKPTRPVAHAAVSLLVSLFAKFPDGFSLPTDYKTFFFDKMFMDQIIAFAEPTRNYLPHVSRFTIREEDTIHFRIIHNESRPDRCRC